jgi:excisionase family DNA binding protein
MTDLTALTALALTIPDAAKALGIGRTGLYGLIGSGAIQARKIGNRTVVPTESLRAYLTSLPPANIHTGRSHPVA